MKKFLSLVLTGVLGLSLVACGGSDSTTDEALETLTVGATLIPHAEILEFVKDDLEAEGINLVVEEFTEYTLLNPALTQGDLDANYFQHQPFLDSYIADHGDDLVLVGNVHVEPLRVYSETLTSLSELENGATIAIPNDATNEGRALRLLEIEGLITLNPEAGILGTPKDIIDNPKNLEFIELEAYMLPRTLDEVDCAVIQTNVALEFGVTSEKSIAVEDADSPYANGIVVRAID